MMSAYWINVNDSERQVSILEAQRLDCRQPYSNRTREMSKNHNSKAGKEKVKLKEHHIDTGFLANILEIEL